MMTLLAMAVLLQDAPLIGPPILYRPCGQDADEAEIVVCGDPDAPSPWRLSEPVVDEKGTLPNAAIALSETVALSAEAEGVEVGGQPSRRAMIRLKIGF